jgi:hypothetical protein
MIPFENTWPYELIMGDVYVSECPFCRTPQVLIPLKKKDLTAIRDGKKKLLVFPCCHQHLTVIDTDRDYLLTNQPLRRRSSP